MRRVSETTIVAAAFVAVSACAGDGDVMRSDWQLNEAETRPNVVVVMVDDLDVDTMGQMLELDLVPNIERYMVRGGVTFDQSFISNAICCPSRATFMTGQYSHNNGVLTVKAADEDGGVDALDDSSTLATWLQDAGYYTGHIGKYLNGYGTDRFSEVPQFQPRYVPPGWDHWQATIGHTTYNTFNYRINDTVDGVTRIKRYGETAADYQTTVLTRRATRFIREAEARDDAQPFFLMVTPLAPHAEGKRDKADRWSWYLNPDPMDAIEKPEQMALIQTLVPASFDKPSFDYTDDAGPTWLRTIGRYPLSEADKANMISFHRDRVASMLAVDDMVGSIIGTLRRNDELDSTIVFFTSDNGFLFGEHRMHGKQVAFDESIRVPLYVRIPGVAGTIIDKKVVNADLAPTITELTGALPGLPMDGRSLLPLVADTSTPWRERVLLEHWGEFPRIPTYAGFRTDRYLYIEYLNGSGERELYDLVQDPFQTDNVWGVEGHQLTGEALAGHLPAMRECADGSCQLLEAEL
jgi:N-acetylglucosamine-6-sulfatase